MQPIGPLSAQIWYRVNWREQQARDYSLQAADTYVERYRLVLRKKEDSGDDEMVAVHLLSNDKWLRGQIEAYTMAGMSPLEISTRFTVSQRTISTFCKVFCDVEPLKEHTGSMLRACFDDTTSKDTCRMRLFGLRYGTIFLDWILSKITVLSADEFQMIENRLRSALLMKASEIEIASLSDTERVDSMLKIIKILSQYKAQLTPATGADDLENVLNHLKGLVKTAPAPKGLSAEALEADRLLTAGPGTSRKPTLRTGMN